MAKFSVGDRVLVHGSVQAIVEHPGSPPCAVVKTVLGHTIVEDCSGIVPDDRSPSRPAVSYEARIETLSRAMCKADSVDSDWRASTGTPLTLSTGYVMTAPTFEAWRLYARYARALIDGGLA
jgi:hypothetical protein